MSPIQNRSRATGAITTSRLALALFFRCGLGVSIEATPVVEELGLGQMGI